MVATAQRLLDSFELLPETEKRTVAIEIIRRTVKFDWPILSDEELVLNAEKLFGELDQRESENERA